MSMSNAQIRVTLTISAELRAALQAWADEYELTLGEAVSEWLEPLKGYPEDRT